MSGTIVGSVLGKYRILSELSSGGMGDVYRAKHEILGRTAAVKLLKPEWSEDPTLVARFVNEAKAASAIRHPGIIEVLDFGTTDDGRAYLVMELLEGEPLSARIAKRGKLSDHEAAAIGRGIAGALSAAHAKGIVHRDLKPDNVFLVPDIDMPSGERPKVLDFGIAKLAESGTRNTQTGVLIGTPTYMAPEQARAAAHIDHRADLYSLGCILYELVVGAPPFLGSGSGELIARHFFEQPEPPRQRVASVSPLLESVILKLLQKDPEARYQSAQAVLEALHLRQPASTASTTIPQPLSRDEAPAPAPARQRNLMPLVAGAIMLALVLVVVGVVVLAHGDEPTPVAKTPPPAPSPAAPSPPLAPAPPPAPVTVTTPPPVPPVTKIPKAPRPKPPAQTGSDKTHTQHGFPTEPGLD